VVRWSGRSRRFGGARSGRAGGGGRLTAWRRAGCRRWSWSSRRCCSRTCRPSARAIPAHTRRNRGMAVPVPRRARR
jgi:hypothetical protein